MNLLPALFFIFISVCTQILAVDKFPGDKEQFHGADLYTLSVGVDKVNVLVPLSPKKGNPWILSSGLYNLESKPVSFMTQLQLDLVKHGYHVVAFPLGNTFGSPAAIAKYDVVYQQMTTKYGLAEKTSLMGLSREGLAITRWAAANPGKVNALYLDKAVCDFKSWPGGKQGVGKGSPEDWQSLIKHYGFKTEQEALDYKWNPIDLAAKLAAFKVAILYLAGEKDEAVPFSENGELLQKEYKRLGGTFELIMHQGEGHHPHGSPDSKPIVDFFDRHSVNLSINLPAPGSPWKPVAGHIMTPWANDVTPVQPLPEYPRPQLVRNSWINLNGLWDYKIQPMVLPQPEQFTGKILVPFPVESALSGVKTPVWKDERLWYRKTFLPPELTNNKRLLLHFGAVDWEAKVFLNSKIVGEHRGGFDAFTFDITDAIKPGVENELTVAVFDATGQGQATGKQNYNKFNKPASIAYTACTGIWQTVWLEMVAHTHISQLKLIPDVDAASLRIKVLTSDNSLDRDVLITAWNGQQEIARIQGRSGTELKLPIPNARLWSPEDPFLYDLKVRLGDDEVSSYFAMRKVALGKDENGFTSILLNNKPVFQAGPLDQGYWPDGIFTAPTDEALRWDLSEMKRLGFNMVRKHIKVEPERWFYWCDKLGLLVWQDMPSGGGGGGGDREKEGKIGNPEVAKQFEAELREMIDQFENHPSIIMWVIFNEAWGQYDTQRLTNEVKSLDPSRIINSSSGWADVGCGDINDWHVYPGPACPEPEAKRAVALGEFGGIGLSIPDHTWTGSAWGYRSVSGVRSLTRRYVDLWRDVWKLKAKNGLCAAIYTQWTDIETEGNGLYTYDRKILKVDPQQVADAHRGHFNPPTTFEIVIPTSKDQPALWRYTTEQPATSWYEQSFNDKSWREAEAGFGMKDFSHATARTLWDSEEIWLRRDFVLPQGKLNHPALHVLHGQEVEIYLNGVLAVRKSGRNSEYEEFDISEAAIQTLKPGLNQISIHAQRGKNSNFIDVGLVQERK